jgi:hypothetical protein
MSIRMIVYTILVWSYATMYHTQLTPHHDHTHDSTLSTQRVEHKHKHTHHSRQRQAREFHVEEFTHRPVGESLHHHIIGCHVAQALLEDVRVKHVSGKMTIQWSLIRPGPYTNKVLVMKSADVCCLQRKFQIRRVVFLVWSKREWYISRVIMRGGHVDWRWGRMWCLIILMTGLYGGVMLDSLWWGVHVS